MLCRFLKGTVHPKTQSSPPPSMLMESQWSLVVLRTVLELHGQTELQRSAEQLKQLRLNLKPRNNQKTFTWPSTWRRWWLDVSLSGVNCSFKPSWCVKLDGFQTQSCKSFPVNMTGDWRSWISPLSGRGGGAQSEPITADCSQTAPANPAHIDRGKQLRMFRYLLLHNSHGLQIKQQVCCKNTVWASAVIKLSDCCLKLFTGKYNQNNSLQWLVPIFNIDLINKIMIKMIL